MGTRTEVLVVDAIRCSTMDFRWMLASVPFFPLRFSFCLLFLSGRFILLTFGLFWGDVHSRVTCNIRTSLALHSSHSSTFCCCTRLGQSYSRQRRIHSCISTIADSMGWTFDGWLAEDGRDGKKLALNSSEHYKCCRESELRSWLNP